MGNLLAIQKESTDFGHKCGRDGDLENCGEKCAAKSWASKPHPQKVRTFFSTIEKCIDPEAKEKN